MDMKASFSYISTVFKLAFGWILALIISLMIAGFLGNLNYALVILIGGYGFINVYKKRKEKKV